MLLPLLVGAIVSVMVSINGNLTGCLGAYTASMVIHAVGTVFAWVLCIAGKKKVLHGWGVPMWAYCGGLFGIMTSLCQSSSYGHISMTCIVALGLLGQTLISTLLDALGLLGMQKRPIGTGTCVGLIISCAGAAIMMDATVATGNVAIFLALGAGAAIVINRTINARLAQQAGPLVSSCVNHMVGLCGSIVLCFVMFDTVSQTVMVMPKPWMFLGGTMGVISVLLQNIAVPKMSAFRMSLMIFLGQMFSGFLIDFATGQDISGKMFWGSVVCGLGFLVSLIPNRFWKKKES